MLLTRRRALLRSVAGVAALTPAMAACELLDFEPEPPPPLDPLTGFHGRTLRLAARYDAELAAAGDRLPVLTAIRDAHLAHAAALAAVMRPPPAASPSAEPSATPGVGPDPGGLREMEQAAWREAVDSCIAAPAGRAVLLGEIAAARACHLEALR